MVLTHDWVVMHFNGSAVVRSAAAVLLDRGPVRARRSASRPSRCGCRRRWRRSRWAAALGYATARVAGARAGTRRRGRPLDEPDAGRSSGASRSWTRCSTCASWSRSCAGSRAGRTVDPARAARFWRHVALAFGTLAKGPVAPVIVVLVIGVWLVWERRRARAIALPASRTLRARAVALFADRAAPWFVARSAARRAASARRTDRPLHVRPLHRRDREPARTVVVLRARS